MAKKKPQGDAPQDSAPQDNEVQETAPEQPSVEEMKTQVIPSRNDADENVVLRNIISQYRSDLNHFVRTRADDYAARRLRELDAQMKGMQ